VACAVIQKRRIVRHGSFLTQYSHYEDI